MTELFRIEDLKVHFQARKGFLGSVVVKALVLPDYLVEIEAVAVLE